MCNIMIYHNLSTNALTYCGINNCCRDFEDARLLEIKDFVIDRTDESIAF